MLWDSIPLISSRSPHASKLCVRETQNDDDDDEDDDDGEKKKEENEKRWKRSGLKKTHTHAHIQIHLLLKLNYCVSRKNHEILSKY